MNINPNTQKWLDRLLLAPQFTTSKYKVLVDAATKGGPAGSLARQAVIGKSVVLGTIATLGTLLATGQFPNLTQILTNFTTAPSIQTNITNPKGQKQDVTLPKSFISEPAGPIAGLLQGDIQPTIDYGQARLNPAISDAQDLITNQDFYGQPIVDPASTDPAALQIAKNLGIADIPIGAQAIAKVIKGQLTPQQAFMNIIGLNTKTSANDPTKMIQTLGNQAYDAAYKQSLASGKSDTTAKITAGQAYKVVMETGQAPNGLGITQTVPVPAPLKTPPASGLSNLFNIAPKPVQAATPSTATQILTKDNKVISLTPPTQGNGISAFTNNTWKATTARTVWDAKSAGNLTDQQATDAFTQLGVNPNDARYDSLAHHTDTEKTQYIVSKSPDHQTLLNNLITGRVVGIGGTQVAADGVLTQLYDQGYISQSEEKALKAYKVDSTGKNLMSGVASSSGLTAAQLRAKITTLNSLYKQMSTATKVKTPTMPKIKTPTLSLTTKKRTAKTKNQWFSAY